MGEPGEGPALVVVALPGVQRFIAEARSTADVSAASGIYSRLAYEVVGSLRTEPGAELILPATGLADSRESGMPNRVVALVPAGTGESAAGRAVVAADEAGRSLVRAVWRLPPDAPVPPAPGFPVVQWVCVPAGDGGYPQQWRRAQRLITARRRVRDFAPVPDEAPERAPPRTPAGGGQPSGRGTTRARARGPRSLG